MNPVSRITDEGRRGSFEGRGGLVLIKRGAGLEVGGRGGGRTGGQFVRGSYKSFKGMNLTVIVWHAMTEFVYFAGCSVGTCA